MIIDDVKVQGKRSNDKHDDFVDADYDDKYDDDDDYDDGDDDVMMMIMMKVRGSRYWGV